MNINSGKSEASNIKKHIFQLRTLKTDGLILRLLNENVNSNNKKIRFTLCSFNEHGNLLASADSSGNVFLIDFTQLKYWIMPKFDSCSVLKFSSTDPDKLLIGLNCGKLIVVDIHSGIIIAKLKGHTKPVKNISFANYLCLTSSTESAIIFDLRTYSVVDTLVLQHDAVLKYVSYVPVTNHIITCHGGIFIQIWKNETLEPWKKISLGPQKNSAKCFAFSKDGRLLVIGGYLPFILIYILSTWQLSRTISFTKSTNIVEEVEFISQVNDGGANKILAVLLSDGCIYFLNMETEHILNKIQCDTGPIISMSCQNGVRLAAILCSGEINVYDTEKFIMEKLKPTKNIQKSPLKYVPLKKQTMLTLELKKIYEILQTYGEYPELYRNIIWVKILNLPNNTSKYSASINRGLSPVYEKLELQYPLINKTALKNCKRLLSNLGNWCPIFNYVKFLPMFVFPFIKVFENDPIACFESVCTIIINWCQHWFEYLPYPPINVLAMIEKNFAEHDPELLKHLTVCGVTSQQYAWSLLEVAFSEVLTIKEWCVFWDHVLSNEPSFFLIATVSYNITFRSSLLSMNSTEDFEIFYHSQNLIDLKKFLSKTYYLNSKTSDLNHPRKYLKDFENLKKDIYPEFNNYPKIFLDFERRKYNSDEKLHGNLIKIIDQMKDQTFRDQNELNKQELNQEENKRLQELEDYYLEQTVKEKEKIERQNQEINKIKLELNNKKLSMIESARKNLEETNLQERKRAIKKILLNLEEAQVTRSSQNVKNDAISLENYLKLIEQKKDIEKCLEKMTIKNLSNVQCR